jgi:hypothetical protein
MARYSISITDEKRVGENFLVTKSTESFEERFDVLRESHKDCGILAIATLSITNDVREVA